VWFRGNRKAPVGVQGIKFPEGEEVYGEWGGNTRYRVTQITYPVPYLVWAI